ncbi:hypothetical protein CALCODRAFT_448741 [Calocera cornea HHB12733]|uniref:Family A G protein-coupled receptor-like protein n=1 Tax=Calocera cornea HHB12733 TaxID=1353952 RepID=A0A165ID82_9BASI|nr:hypothetical protein CALCODRAFT_448741 [Calocera cornea HHB12733]
MSLSVETADLAGLFAGSILYGMFLVLMGACLYVLLYRRKTARPNYLLVVTSCIMFIVNTLILALTFARIVDAFIQLGDVPGGAEAYLTQISEWKEVARNSLCSVYIFVADLTLIYRCWIVWSRSLAVVAVPIMIHIAYTVTSFILNVNMAHIPPEATVFDPSAKAWIVTTLSLSLGQNVIVTSLIVFKIMSVNARATGKRMGSLRSTISALVESGALYVITVFVYLVTYGSDSNSQYIMIDILNPIIGITYSMLVVRVGLGQSTHSLEGARNNSDPHGHRVSRSVVVEVEQTRVVDETDSLSEFDGTKWTSQGHQGVAV